MVGATKDFPDFTHGILLLGVDADGNQVGVLLDSTGQMFTILRGVDGSGDPQTVRVDSDGQLYTVLQGASGNAVTVDGDGFLTTVLKGALNGTLTTISVDVNGRIEAFVLDAENQWGGVVKVGNAELAARLGSSVAWDARGQVLVLTDFSNGWPPNWLTTSGAGAAAVLSPDMWQRGGYSVKLIGGSDASKYASVLLKAGPNPTGKVGVACSFACSDTPEFMEVKVIYQVSTGGVDARAHIDFDNGKLQVRDSAGVWQNIATVSPFANPDYFHSFKLVVDVDTEVYERVLLDDVEIDASAYSAVHIAAGGDEVFTSVARVFSHAGNNEYAFVDSMVLTTQEPVNA